MAGFSSGGFDSEEEFSEPQDLAEINIVPLVDIMLVLLVVFMVAAPLSISGIQIKLPEADAKGRAVSEGPIVLTIDAGGKYFIGKAEVLQSELNTRFAAIFSARKDKSLYIRADKKVVYYHVVDAMDAAKKSGVEKLSVLTKPRSG